MREILERRHRIMKLRRMKFSVEQILDELKDKEGKASPSIRFRNSTSESFRPSFFEELYG